MSLRIGILGTRGVPNQYGGFEQFAAYLSAALVSKGHALFVYTPHNHPYRENTWKGVTLVRCYDPSGGVGTVGQFVYDLNCVLDARNQKFDILLVLGYTSSSVWGWLYPRDAVVITNMDGLEWKRTKYSFLVRRFLQYAERLAVKFSGWQVADSVPIQEYLYRKYQIRAHYISYGAEIPQNADEDILLKYGLEKKRYFLLIARMEPENMIETILDGLQAFCPGKKILVIGSVVKGYGKRMLEKFGSNPNIIFAGTIYEKDVLQALRTFCRLYFHGHSVGGTNPSLLEAMACGALICAHDNVFNRSVLGEDAFYFSNVMCFAKTDEWMEQLQIEKMIQSNLRKIKEIHSWEKIVDEYEGLFFHAKNKKK